jgi:hypothetical protein
VAADQIEAIFIHPHLIAEWRSGCHGLPVKTGLTRTRAKGACSAIRQPTTPEQ